MNECQHGEPRGARYCAFCRKLGIALGESGKQTALDNAPHQWRERFDRALTYLASLDDPFTVDDVIARAGLPRMSEMNKNNAVGAIMSAAARRGLIRRTGYEQAGRSLSHGRAVSVWQGVRTWSSTAY